MKHTTQKPSFYAIGNSVSSLKRGYVSFCALILLVISSAVNAQCPPTITTQPQTQTTAIGCSVTFSVVAATNNPSSLTYTWQKNGSTISGANAATFTINPVAAGDAADYTVVVTSDCGTIVSNIATLTVNPALDAGAHNTTAQTECVNYDPASLSFTTAPSGGSTPYTYQWQLNGSPISGATSSSYDPPNLVTPGMYSYNCVVTDACGTSAVTQAKVITIVANPSVTISGGGTVCLNGSIAALTSVVTGGVTITYEWQSATAIGGPYTPISGATSSTYSPPTNTAGTIYYRLFIPNVGSCNSATSMLFQSLLILFQRFLM